MLTKKSDKLESLIGPNSTFKGDISTKGTIRLDGTLEGTVEADWLVLGDKGLLRGRASARVIIVGGKVEGNFLVVESVEIKQKGSVEGDIQTMRLTVLEGGVLNGRMVMSGNGKAPATAPKPEPAGA